MKINHFDFEQHLLNYLKKMTMDLENNIPFSNDDNEKYCLNCKLFFDPILEEGHETHMVLQDIEDLQNQNKIKNIFENLEHKYFSLFLKDLDTFDEKFKRKIEDSINDLINLLNKLKDSKIEDFRNFRQNHERKFEKIKKQYFDLKFKYSNFSKKNDYILKFVSNNSKNNRKKSIENKNAINNSINNSIMNLNLNNNSNILNKSNLSNTNNLFIFGDRSLIEIMDLINLDLNIQIEIAEKNFENFLNQEKELFMKQEIDLETIFSDFKKQVDIMIEKQISDTVNDHEVPSFDKAINLRIKKYSEIFEKLNDNFLKAKTRNYKDIEKRIVDIESKFILKAAIRKGSLDLISPFENIGNFTKADDKNFINNLESINKNLDNFNENIHNLEDILTNKKTVNNSQQINAWTNVLKSQAITNLNLTDKSHFKSPTKKIDFSKISLSDYKIKESLKNSNFLKQANGISQENPEKNNEKIKSLINNNWNKNFKINQKIDNLINSDKKVRDKNIFLGNNNNIQNLKINQEPIKLVNSSKIEEENINLNFMENENSICIINEQKENYYNLKYDETQRNKIIFKSKSSNTIKNDKSNNPNNDLNLFNGTKNYDYNNKRKQSHASSSTLNLKPNESNLKLNISNFSNKNNISGLISSQIPLKKKCMMKKYLILSLLENIEDIENEENFKNMNETNHNLKEGKMKLNGDNSFSFINDQYNQDPIVVKIIDSSTELLLYDRYNSEIKKFKISLLKDLHGIEKFSLGSRALIMEDKIFIAGGKDENNSYNVFLEFDYKTNELKAMQNMISSRAYFTIFYNSHFRRIFCIGGEQNKTCEYFDLYNKKWKKLPELNYPRAYINCYFVKREINHNIKKDEKNSIKEVRFYLYALFGIKSEMSKTEFTDTIEVLELDKDGDPIDFVWQKVEFNNRSDVDLKNNYVRIFPIEDDKIIIIGNCFSRYNKKSYACYDMTKGLINKLDSKILFNIKKRSEKNPTYKQLFTDINTSLNTNAQKKI